MPTEPVTLSDIATSIEELQSSVGQLKASATKTEIAIADLDIAVSDAVTSIRDNNVSIDDLGTSIADTGTMMMEALAASENRLRVEFRLSLDSGLGRLDKRIAALEIAQRETNERLERMEGRQEALVEDIKELYDMITNLRKEFKHFTEDERRRYRTLVRWARKVAAKTGIPFQA